MGQSSSRNFPQAWPQRPAGAARPNRKTRRKALRCSSVPFGRLSEGFLDAFLMRFGPPKALSKRLSPLARDERLDCLAMALRAARPLRFRLTRLLRAGGADDAKPRWTLPEAEYHKGGYYIKYILNIYIILLYYILYIKYTLYLYIYIFILLYIPAPFRRTITSTPISPRFRTSTSTSGIGTMRRSPCG